MKRLIIFTVAIAMFIGLNANAQGLSYGIMAGFTSSSSNVKDFKTNSVSLYQAGIAMRIPIAAGFVIQPGLVYQVKGASLDKTSDLGFLPTLKSMETKVGFLEIPVQIQWGPDLMAFRPYVFAEPFVGMGLNTDNTMKRFGLDNRYEKDFKKAAISRLEYGLGLGAGVEVWKLQLSVRYFWNFGSLYEDGDSGKDVLNDVAQTVKGAFKDQKNFNGITASLAFFF